MNESVYLHYNKIKYGFPTLQTIHVHVRIYIKHRCCSQLAGHWSCSQTKLLCVSFSHSLAASGDLEGLEIWSLAGADLNKPGYDGQTAVEVVRSELFRGARATFHPQNKNHEVKRKKKNPCISVSTPNRPRLLANRKWCRY